MRGGREGEGGRGRERERERRVCQGVSVCECAFVFLFSKNAHTHTRPPSAVPCPCRTDGLGRVVCGGKHAVNTRGGTSVLPRPPPHTGGGSEGRGWGGVGGGWEGKERKTHTRGTHRKTRVGASTDDKIRNKKNTRGHTGGGERVGGGEGRGEGTGWAGAGVVVGRRRKERAMVGWWCGGAQRDRAPSLPLTLDDHHHPRHPSRGTNGGVEAQGK